MGLFNFFRKDKPKKATYNYNRKYDFSNIMKEIEANKYINDAKAKALYKKAFKLTENNLIDRHFYYNSIIDYHYALRDKEKDALEKCIEYCKEDIKIAPKVLNLMKRDEAFKYYNEAGKLVFTPPRFPSFHRLAIIYENQGKYDDAIKVCEKAIQLNLKDGTKTGFEGRIKRLEKKINKEAKNV